MPKADRFANVPRPQGPARSMVEADAQIYGTGNAGGGVGAPDAGRIVAKPITIYDIHPDPRQPRRAIPSEIRQVWDGNPETVRAMFNYWVEMVGGESFPLINLLTAAGDQQTTENDALPEMSEGGERDAEDTLRRLIALAGSIHRVGLNFPITVVGTGANGKYRIEQGERRWLAYHLLYIVYNDEKYLRIPARVEQKYNVWRQAAENNIRTNLNAISKTRQFALLLIDLYGEDNFLPYDAFKLTPGAPDRVYYAQVSDGWKYPIPSGYGELVVATMGMKYTQQLREYRSLLRIPDAVWLLADDYNWTLGFITKLMEMSENDNQLIQLAWDVARKHHRRREAPESVKQAVQDAAFAEHQREATVKSADMPDDGGYTEARMPVLDKRGRVSMPMMPRPQARSVDLWERTVRQIENVVRNIQHIDMDDIDIEIRVEVAKMLRRALARLEP